MSTVGQREILTQRRLIRFFQDELGYAYLGNWKERPGNACVEAGLLTDWLRRQGHGEKVIERTLLELSKAKAIGGGKNLYDANREVYRLLRYGVKVRPGVGEPHVTVWLIDWHNPAGNDFAVAEEVSVAGVNPKRPDVVLYVNGIALGVLELKRSTVAVSEGIRQQLDSQQKAFIEPFYATVQLVMAGNDTEGLRYGVIETPEKYWLTWKEAESGILGSRAESSRSVDEGRIPLFDRNDKGEGLAHRDGGVDDGAASPGDASIPQHDGGGTGHGPLDRGVGQLCGKGRLLEIVHDFIVFDAGTKKACRHNQYFGVRAAQEHVRRREGGIIWHTQGSGKSLTMVWLAKWIRENVTDARVLIITDRTELDEQIEGVFKGVGEGIARTKSGAGLVGLLNRTEPWLICSLIHKFGRSDEDDFQAYIAEIKKSLPKGFRAKGEIFVFVDECHRTQSGKLHEAMKTLLPDAMFIGFTGTPLLKADKQKSIEVFGPYIHTYKYDEAVRDKVVLDLRYEARDIDQNVTSQAKVDQWFEVKTNGLSDWAKAQLKERWGTMQKVLSAQDRLAKIVNDILWDMETRDRLMSGRGNALLVSDSIYSACRFYEMFQRAGFKGTCAIVTSYRPDANAIKGEETGEGTSEKLLQYEVYREMLADHFDEPKETAAAKVEQFEQEVKRRFVEEPGQMKLLIVVDKLLTGFDAPPATYLYIDKQMRDHGLFQAICRVNRLDGDDKEYGYVVDYKDLFRSLEKSIHDYTGEAFEGYDAEDVAGLLKDRLEAGRERLEEAREAIKALCEPVEPPRDTLAYQHFFCAEDTSDREALKENEPKRVKLYAMTASLVRAYANLATEMSGAGYSDEEARAIKAEVTHFEAVRKEVQLAAGDNFDRKVYEPAMRHLLDTYVRAEESVPVSAFDDLTLVELIVERGAGAVDALPAGMREKPEAMAEAIENNVRRVIIDEMAVNPKYYERMSDLLDALILQRKQQALDYKTYLAKIVELTKQVQKPETGASYPPAMTSGARRALYDNLGRNADLAERIDVAIRTTKQDDWRGNKVKQRQILNAIREQVGAYEVDLDELFKLVKHQREY